jgi:hypothetical protein
MVLFPGRSLGLGATFHTGGVRRRSDMERLQPSQNQLVAAGYVLSRLGPHAGGARIRLDGQVVLSAAEIVRRYRDLQRIEDPGAVERWVQGQMTGIQDQVDSFKERHVRVGRVADRLEGGVQKLIEASGTVHRAVQVEVLLETGRQLSVPVDVIDLKLSRALLKSSLAVTVLGIPPIPGVGFVVNGVAALGACLGSLAAGLKGDGELQKTLTSFAAKHVVVLGLGALPVAGALADGSIALMTQRQINALDQDLLHSASTPVPWDLRPPGR